MTEPRDNLDSLFAQAQWPDLPAAHQSRLLARWEAVTPARRNVIWPKLAVAAASMAAGLVAGWLTYEPLTRIERTEVAEVEPAPAEIEPQAEPALPGRAASPLELVMLRRDSQPPAPPTLATPAERVDAAIAAVLAGTKAEPLSDVEPRTLEALLVGKIAADESPAAATVLLAKSVGPAAVNRLLAVAKLYDSGRDEWHVRPSVVQAISALATPAQLRRAVESGEFRENARPLLAALAIHDDRAAAGELIRLTERDAANSREAMTLASDAVLGELIRRLRAPRVADRKAAAWLLSGSGDPRVIVAAHSLLETPAAPAALRLLAQSDQPAAAEVLQAIDRSSRVSPLRAQLRVVRRELPPAADERVAMAV